MNRRPALLTPRPASRAAGLRALSQDCRQHCPGARSPFYLCHDNSPLKQKRPRDYFLQGESRFAPTRSDTLFPGCPGGRRLLAGGAPGGQGPSRAGWRAAAVAFEEGGAPPPAGAVLGGSPPASVPPRQGAALVRPGWGRGGSRAVGGPSPSRGPSPQPRRDREFRNPSPPSRGAGRESRPAHLPSGATRSPPFPLKVRPSARRHVMDNTAYTQSVTTLEFSPRLSRSHPGPGAGRGKAQRPRLGALGDWPRAPRWLRPSGAGPAGTR